MTAELEAAPADAALISQLKAVLGDDGVLSDLDQRTFYSTDLSFRDRAIAAAVIRPRDAETLARAVGICTRAGYAMLARGGGMSYTSGYTPQSERSVLVDMQHMDRVLEINTEDMFVTVECGCTWKTLYEALTAKGVRTPYFGPLSGMYATIGGALSQNSLFMGSGIHRTVAESVLGLKVVLANGELVQTGSAAHRHSNGFYRHFGPDMTGLFTADTGAFGIKAVATLRLIPAPAATAYLSFKFDRLEDMLGAQVELARLLICSECYGFDPYYNAGFEQQGITFEEGISIVGKIARKGGLKGLKQAAKVAMGGKTILREVPYSLHMTLDGHTEAVVAEHVDIAAEICQQAGGVEMTNTIPTVFRAQPFGGVRTVLLGAEGEIWIPVHGFFPLSKAIAAAEATEAFLAEKKPILEQWDIKTSYLTCFSGAEFVIEPSFYWADELGEFRLSLIETEFADNWRGIPADHDKRKTALALRDELRDLYDSLGAMHLQIGKYYPYFDMMSDPNLPQLIKDIKQVVDPDTLMNPGALGLGHNNS